MTRNDDTPNFSGNDISRRSYIKSGILAAAAGGGLVTGSRRVSANFSRSNYTIRTGTDEETTVYVTDSGEPGPTVMVVGGMHGNEPNGYISAGKIKSWDIDAGRLVVLPQANKKGIKVRTRGYDGNEIDLNRQFPAGSEPTTPLAREIWNVVVHEDIDFLVDLHSSYGIYDSGDSGVGQGIFSTQAGNATSYRRELVSYMNANYVSDSTYDFHGATSSDGSSPMLKHKVGADLDTGAIIIEATRKYDRPLTKRVQQTTAAVQEFLQRFGLITDTVKYYGDATPVNTSEDDNEKASGLKFGVTNTFGQNARITDLTVKPQNGDIDELGDHSYDEGKWVSELFVDADVQNGVTDINGGTALPQTINFSADGFSDSASRDAVLSSGSAATVDLYQFKSNGSPVDMAGEPVTFTLHYELADGTRGFDSFTTKSVSPDSFSPTVDEPLVYNEDVIAVDTSEDSNGKHSGLMFSVTNDAGSNLTIQGLDIEPENGDIDQLRDHSYDEGEWVSELFIDADVQNGVTDVNGGMALPGTIDLDTDGFSDSTSRNAVLSSDSSATVNLYQFKANGSPVDMAGEPVTFTLHYKLENGTEGSISFTTGTDSPDASHSSEPAVTEPLVYDGDVVAVDTPEDGNGKRSGLQFDVTNGAESNLTIETMSITPEDGDIDQLRDHSYSEGKWVSELSIDADVQNGVTDINNGTTLPGTIDLGSDGFSSGASRDAVLSSGSSATVSLYQFEANGSPVDMAGKTVEISIGYTVNGTSGTRTITLRP